MIPTNICQSYAHAEKRKEIETPLVSCFCNFCYHWGCKFHWVIFIFGFIYSFARRPYCKPFDIFYFGKQALIQADRIWLNLNTHAFQWKTQILEDNVWYGNYVREGGQYFLLTMVTSDSVPLIHFVQSHDTLVLKKYHTML